MENPYEVVAALVRAALRRMGVAGSTHVGGDLVTGDKNVFMAPTELVKPAQLLPGVAHFIGRKKLLAQLDALVNAELESKGVPRGAVIHGMPGVGKTAVALHFAHLLVERRLFQDGQLFLDLRGFSTQAQMSRREALGQLLRGLGVHEKTIPRAEAEQEALYRSLLAGRQLLIIFDNAASTEQVRPLLPGTRSCLVIVTSRDKLIGLSADGLQALQVVPFGPDEALAYISAVVGAERVEAEPDAARELAQQCAYLPLALRVTAAKIADRPDEPLERAAAELAGRDRLPQLALPDDPNMAVLPALDLSYRALSRKQQRAFALLCLVEGPDFTTEAAAAALGLPMSITSDLVRGLEHVHLVDRIEDDRHTIHDLLREYGRRPGNTDTQSAGTEAIRRLLSHYLERTRGAVRALGRYRRTIRSDKPTVHRMAADVTTRDEALAWLERERANLVAAVRLAYDHGQHWFTWELADALYDFLAARRYGQENDEAHVLGLKAAREAGDRRAELFMLHHLGWIHHQRGSYEQADAYATEALHLSEQDGDQPGQAEACTILARVRLTQGNRREARNLAAKSRKLWRGLGNQHGEAGAHLTMGWICWRASEYDAALVAAIWALDIHQQTGDRYGEADCYDLMAGAFRRIGEYEKAISHAEYALSIRRENGDHYGESGTLLNLARVLRRLERLVEARDHANLALEIRREMGDRRGVAEALTTMARIARDLGQFEAARVLATQALTLARQMSDRWVEAYALHNLAQIHRATGDPATALGHAEAGLDVASGLLDPYGQARRLYSLGLILVDLGRPQEALDRLTEASHIEHQIGVSLNAAGTLQTMAEIHRHLGNEAAAKQIAEKVDELRREWWLLWDHGDE